jgi:hypothetical protein
MKRDIQEFGGSNHTIPAEIREYTYLFRTLRRSSMLKLRDPSDIVGYQITDKGDITPIYKPQQGMVVTHAFIMCSNCGAAIYHCSGPRQNALCLDCVGIENENRNIVLSGN